MNPKIGRRRQVLEALRQAPTSQTVNELARMIGVHGNTVRFHLDSLLADGLIQVEEEPPGQRPVGRPAVRYRAVKRVAPSQMKHTETLVRLFLRDLSEDPEGVDRAQEIGRNWGEEQAQKTQTPPPQGSQCQDINALTALLDDMGFESDPPRGNELLVRACPFLDSVEIERLQQGDRQHLPAVCAVHLGVMKGALEQWDASVGVEELTPFSRPDRCRITFNRSHPE